MPQRSRDDRAGLDGERDDRQWEVDPRRRLCIDRGHLGGAGGLRRGGGDPRHRLPAPRQDLDGPADPADRQRGHGLRPRHRLRRLHGDREEGGGAGRDLPGQLHEQPAHRGPEDRRDRDRPAIRLGSSALE